MEAANADLVIERNMIPDVAIDRLRQKMMIVIRFDMASFMVSEWIAGQLDDTSMKYCYDVMKAKLQGNCYYTIIRITIFFISTIASQFNN